MAKSENVKGFATRWGLVLTLIGASVGTGNVWRFPRMVALNGGGSFVLAWTILLFAISIPIIIAEMVMGRATRHGAPGAFKDFIGKKYSWMGAFMAATTVAIAAYYTVVMGWCLQYAVISLKGFKNYDAEGLTTLFVKVSNGWTNVGVFVLVLIITAVIVSQKISKGIEIIGKFLTPFLYIVLIILVGRALTLPGAIEGVKHYFQISPETFFSADTWMAALSQSAWSVGPGFGLVLTMGVYTKSKSDVALNEFMQGLGDNSAALLAGFAVLPALFALSPSVAAATAICESGNYGLTFIALTQLFANMPGGSILAFLFFLSLFFAALTANVIFFSTGVVPLMDAKMSRKKASFTIFVITLILGSFSAYNIDILSNQDWVWGMALLIGTIFTCFAIWKFGAEKIRTKYINIPENELYIGKWWNVSVLFVTPVLIIGMFGWWIIQSIGWHENWWNPFLVDSTGTFVVQILLLIGVLLIFNKKISESAKNNYIDSVSKGYPEIPEEHEN
ncbi:sodium-dependent transporter [Clostridium sp.]|jgi:NSS family neurotransmitter:Na+ symporter|uniref:sodium-dependent transporter n=1 Tax=Clostridium sp. TaxID=1506 RepID=UPI003EEF8C89